MSASAETPRGWGEWPQSETFVLDLPEGVEVYMFGRSIQIVATARSSKARARAISRAKQAFIDAMIGEPPCQRP